MCGDGNCGYYACLASGSESVLSHCLRSAVVQLAPSREDYEAQQSLRESCVAWLLAPEQTAMLRTEKYDTAAVEKQRKGKRQRGGSMGIYANSAALRAMAAVQQVHLVVISTFTGPSGGKAFKGHGRVVKGCRSIEWSCTRQTTASRFVVSSHGPTTSCLCCCDVRLGSNCQGDARALAAGQCVEAEGCSLEPALPS